MFKLKLLSISTIFILAGCVSLAPEYQRPPAPVPQQFSLSKNSLTPAVNSYQDTGWRNFFVDPQVSRLIGEALNNNRDLRMAALKVEEARAQFNVTDADRYPQLNASSGITYNGGLKGDKPTTQEYDAGLELSYELDFFGKLKNMSEADRQNYFASEEARRAVHILLVSNVSQSYFSQQLAYEQLRIARETLKNYEQSYAFVEQQLVTGSTNVLALEQARGQIESTRAGNSQTRRRSGSGKQCPATGAGNVPRTSVRKRDERRGDRTSKIATKSIFTNFAAATGYYGSGISAESG